MKDKILVITPRLPYPTYSGDLLRIYNICRSLAGTFSITLVSICQSRDEMSARLPDHSPFDRVFKIYLPKWKSYFNVIRAFIKRECLQTAYYNSAEMHDFITERHSEFDLIICHLARTASYASELSIPKILELTDHIPLTYSRSNKSNGGFMSLRRLVYYFEANRIDAFQNVISPKFNLISFVSDIDRSLFLESSGIESSKVVVYHNGINLSERPFKLHRESKTIVFIGTLHSMPNSDAIVFFLSKVLPILLKADKDIVFRVVGAVKHTFARRWASENVEFLGIVPDLKSTLDDCVLGVCPVRIGAGIQNKVLDYMASGLPSVTTSVGAEGLKGVVDNDFVIADDPEQFAEKILFLLNNPVERERIALNARKLIEDQYTWDSCLNGMRSQAKLLISRSR